MYDSLAMEDQQQPQTRQERSAAHHRSWWRRRNRLGVRNGEFLVILVVALTLGALAMYLTALMGVR